MKHIGYFLAGVALIVTIPIWVPILTIVFFLTTTHDMGRYLVRSMKGAMNSKRYR